jgi:hypothetical protein
MIELWHVRLQNGEVRTLDVDQLDAAYHAGSITATTPVLAPGESTWTTLAAAAGLEEPEPAPYSIAPVAMGALEPGYDIDVDLASGLDANVLRPRRWPWVLGFAAVTAFVAAAGFGGMTYAQRTLAASAPPPPPARTAVVVVATPPAPPPPAVTPTPTPTTEAPKAASAMSVTDLPSAKKGAPLKTRFTPRKK